MLEDGAGRRYGGRSFVRILVRTLMNGNFRIR